MKKSNQQLLLSFFLVFAAVGCSATKYVLRDDFNGPILDSTQWEIVQLGDLKSWQAVHLVDGKGGSRLRLLADTMGTSDDSVKYIGVKSSNGIDISSATISFNLDWNNQVNGSYLSAGLYLVPENADLSRDDFGQWLTFRYVGVPPGKNGRCEVLENINGRKIVHFWEGWPENKQGRVISYQRLKIVFSGFTLKVEENGRTIYETDSYRPKFSRANLYLLMSSHSNYPEREVFFDNVTVTTTGGH